MSKTVEELHHIWCKYVSTLPWMKGELDQSSWFAFLRAASLGVSHAEALDVVAGKIISAGDRPKISKLTNQARRAYDSASVARSNHGTWQPRQGWGKPVRTTFDEAKLASFAEEWSRVVDAVWLGNRGAYDPALLSSADFLSKLYEPDERVLAFRDWKGQGDAVWPHDELPKSGPDGVWFLGQPVDGEEHVNPRTGKMSRRSLESVTAWRYLVLESDKAQARHWLGALVQLPLRISAVYTSGGKSIHALIRVDARSKDAWDDEVAHMKAGLTILGGDPAAMTAVRLTRLPNCYRASKGKWQKLLFLKPESTALLPICALPPKRDVEVDWLRYAESWSDEPGAENDWISRGLEHYAPCSSVLKNKLEELKK